MKNYRKRNIEKKIEEKLKNKEKIIIEGVKGSGKETIGKKFCKKTIDLIEIHNQEIENPLFIPDFSSLLKGKIFLKDYTLYKDLLLDKHVVLASSSIKTDTSVHSIRIRPMSLYESGESSGEVSLEKLFLSPSSIKATQSLSIEDLSFLILRGGWPKAVNSTNAKYALSLTKQYTLGMLESDINNIDQSKKDLTKLKAILSSYTRHISYQSTKIDLKNDILENENLSINEDTIHTYLNALDSLFVLEELPAWNPVLKNKVPIRKTPKRYFVDPSFGAVSLSLTPKSITQSLPLLTQLYKNLVLRDLRIYAESLGGTLYHYKDKNNLECDCVIVLEDGRYGLINITLGRHTNKEAISSLNKLESKLDTSKMRQPSFKMIIGFTDSEATIVDDIYIVPIGTLKD